MNIERGLLFAQEPTISRGGQLGYTQGVGTSSTTSGLVFGPNGTNTTQTRDMIDVGNSVLTRCPLGGFALIHGGFQHLRSDLYGFFMDMS